MTPCLPLAGGKSHQCLQGEALPPMWKMRSQAGECKDVWLSHLSGGAEAHSFNGQLLDNEGTILIMELTHEKGGREVGEYHVVVAVEASPKAWGKCCFQVLCGIHWGVWICWNSRCLLTSRWALNGTCSVVSCVSCLCLIGFHCDRDNPYKASTRLQDRF